VGPVAGAAAEPGVEVRRHPDPGQRRGSGDHAQGAGGGVRGRRGARGVDAVRGAGDVLQPPRVRGAAQGGGAGVRVPAPDGITIPCPAMRFERVTAPAATALPQGRRDSAGGSIISLSPRSV
jgi:hypothetical protein